MRHEDFIKEKIGPVLFLFVCFFSRLSPFAWKCHSIFPDINFSSVALQWTVNDSFPNNPFTFSFLHLSRLKSTYCEDNPGACLYSPTQISFFSISVVVGLNNLERNTLWINLFRISNPNPNAIPNRRSLRSHVATYPCNYITVIGV